MINLHESICRFILEKFDVDLNGYVCRRQQDQSQAGNNVQGEESDFEFMMTEEVKEDKERELERKKTRRSFFEY